MNSKCVYFLVLLFFSAGSFAEKNSSIEIELLTPRTYGFSLGDEIMATASIHTSFGYQLLQGSMPQPGQINNGLSLTRTELEEDQNGYDYQLHLYYQVFKSVKESTQLTIPAIELQFDNRLKNITKTIPAWNFTYNPLISAATPDNQISIQAPMKPELLSATNHYPIIFFLISVTLLLALYLAWIYDKLPFLSRYSGPFGQSIHKLSLLNKNPVSESNIQDALLCFHQAMNKCAGKTVFRETLANFYQNHPEFSKTQQKTEQLFDYSQQLFFSESNRRNEKITTEQILELCQIYRKIERGTRWS